jgi:hypothetical protein
VRRPLPAFRLLVLPFLAFLSLTLSVRRLDAREEQDKIEMAEFERHMARTTLEKEKSKNKKHKKKKKKAKKAGEAGATAGVATEGVDVDVEELE